MEELSPYRTVVTRQEASALAALHDARLLLELAGTRQRAVSLVAFAGPPLLRYIGDPEIE